MLNLRRLHLRGERAKEREVLERLISDPEDIKRDLTPPAVSAASPRQPRLS
jgi:hypothetical protein